MCATNLVEADGAMLSMALRLEEDLFFEKQSQQLLRKVQSFASFKCSIALRSISHNHFAKVYFTKVVVHGWCK
ncbi:hypothetical protein ACQKCH_10715 [Nubsella zeaxanthinifaciens]|uniref:hypothetical protein n=1 Tax=Nubsella zeaxanthinifaciens TaxID=392412 RepID=UPI003CFCC16B